MSTVAPLRPENQAAIEERNHRASFIDFAVGSVWLAFVGGAISMRDAERLDRALKNAACRPPPIPEWVYLGSPTRH